MKINKNKQDLVILKQMLEHGDIVKIVNITRKSRQTIDNFFKGRVTNSTTFQVIIIATELVIKKRQEINQHQQAITQDILNSIK